MSIQAQDYLVREKTKDGRTVIIRSIHAEDKQILQEGMHHLSAESLYFRFFTFKKELTDKELIYFTEMDFVHHVGLLACMEINGEERPAGVGRYIEPKDKAKYLGAELAFAVDEDFQDLGIGTILMKHLTLIARANGIKQFFAFVLPENRKMLAVFRHSGLPMEETRSDVGVCEITLSLV